MSEQIQVTPEEVADWLSKELAAFPVDRKEIFDSVLFLLRTPSERTILLEQLTALRVYIAEGKADCPNCGQVSDAIDTLISSFSMLVLIAKKVDERKKES